MVKHVHPSPTEEQKTKKKQRKEEPIIKKKKHKSEGKKNILRTRPSLSSSSLPLPSSSPGKAFLFLLFLHLLLQKKKQGEVNLITFTVCRACVVWTMCACCPARCLGHWLGPVIGLGRLSNLFDAS